MLRQLFCHRSGPHNGSNLVGPSVIGDLRGQTHTRGHSNNRMYQQSVPPSSLQNAPFPPTRRSRPRGFTLISSLATTSSSSEIGGFPGFSSVSNSASRSHQGAENISPHFDRFYGWDGREHLAPLPWIPQDGSQSQLWSAFNPNVAPHPGGSTFLQRAIGSQRISRRLSENASQRTPPPSRRPPPSFMWWGTALAVLFKMSLVIWLLFVCKICDAIMHYNCLVWIEKLMDMAVSALGFGIMSVDVRIWLSMLSS